jgi:maltooligosyltrehalose synthase
LAPAKKPLQNKLLIPVLGDHYGNIRERRELRLKFDADAGESSVFYYHHRFPIDPRTYPFILNARHAQLLKVFDPADPLRLEYQMLDGSFRKLPDRTTTHQSAGTLFFRSARGSHSRRTAATSRSQRCRCLTGFYVPLLLKSRIQAYMLKAVREAKQYSSWQNPDQDYEQAVSDFVCYCLDWKANHVFLDNFTAFEKWLRRAGLYNALGQTLLGLTSPGVPDVYQGNEIWQFSLVDPDNRRSVDFEINRQLLSTIDGVPGDDRLSLLKSLMDTPEDGRIKLFLTAQTLRLRSQHAALFENGEYLKLSINGPRFDNLVAFARRDPEHFVVILVPRLMKHLLDEYEVWVNTRLELPADAPLHYSNIFTTGKLSAKAVDGHLELDIEDMLGAFPVALLVAR